MPARLRHGAGTATVPNELAHVGYNGSRNFGRRIFGGSYGIDEIDGAASCYSFPTNDAVGEDSEILRHFAEKDDHAFCGGEIGRDENWDVWLVRASTKRKACDFEKGSQARKDHLTDTF